MPRYVKFLKDVLAKKRKLGEYENVALSKERNVILQKNLPLKLQDMCSFTIPYAIGNSIFKRALCDLSASINLMRLSIFKKMNLGQAILTTLTLQLAY